MHKNNTSTKHASKKEFSHVASILSRLGFELEKDQPHMSGERHLMQAVTTASGKKFILLARRKSDNKRVVIKVTRDKEGAAELTHERVCREALQKINFAYKIFFSPKKMLFTEKDGYTISVQEYVDQKSTFLERPLEEQFELALKAFKAQESAHATTYKHRKTIAKTFGQVDASWYLKSYKTFQENLKKYLPEKSTLHELIHRGSVEIEEHREIIEQYSNFLTQTDFVPHNFRVVDGNIYLLDSSSLRFGNKYEGWARFLNFMTLYNRPLEDALIFYIKNNRTEEELVSLKLMRIYRLGEIIWYYAQQLEKTTGDLHTLTEKRIEFWTSVLESILKDKQVSEEVIASYKKTRDNLRSEDEKKRQIGLH